ncbi:ABC transporter substrate-binding protein [Amycolatopsis jejuensis]|uniref:ABC transporter substrate-binding protein n=1 Tax=Amycolatopsis jejuensis TaxID=330084 RepID=UPI0005243DB2|nr:ABC transporter substrate-binding protein [Amycolatopsis jejuensis]
MLTSSAVRRLSLPVLAVLLAGCAPSEGEQGATITTPFALSAAMAPEMVAVSEGLFAKQGISVRLNPGNGSAQALQQVATGQADLTTVGGSDLLSAVANEGAPLLSVASKKQVLPYYLVSSADAAITSPQQLTGKSVGVLSVGGTTSQTLNLFLAAGGVDPKSVTQVVAPNSPATLDMVRRGQIAAYVSNLEVASVLRAEKTPATIVDLDQTVRVPGAVWVVCTELTKSAPAKVSALLAGLAAAMEFLRTDGRDGTWTRTLALFERDYPEVARDRAGLIVQLNAQYREWFGESGAAADLKNSPERWQAAIDFATRSGLIKGTVPAGTLYSNDYLAR